MMRVVWLAALLAGLACANKGDESSQHETATPDESRHESQSGAPAPQTTDAGKAPTDKRQRPPREYFAALREGRAAVKSRDYTGAVSAFERALSLAPNDARALSELSVAALRAGDASKARKAASESVAAALQPDLKAASLYNLALAHRAEGDTEAAREAAKQSLQLRPHPVVDKLLVSLGGPHSKHGLLSPALLDGPFTEAEVCAKYFDGKPCELVRKGEANGVAPFQSLVLADPIEPGRKLLPDYERPGALVMAQVAGKWFVTDRYNLIDADHVSFAHVEVEAIEFFKTARGPVGVLRISSSLESKHADYSEYFAILCGVGPSKKVSCSRVVNLGSHNVDIFFDDTGDIPEAEQVNDTRRSLTIKPSGEVVITGAGKHPLHGSHRLEFP